MFVDIFFKKTTQYLMQQAVKSNIIYILNF